MVESELLPFGVRTSNKYQEEMDTMLFKRLSLESTGLCTGLSRAQGNDDTTSYEMIVPEQDERWLHWELFGVWKNRRARIS